MSRLLGPDQSSRVVLTAKRSYAGRNMVICLDEGGTQPADVRVYDPTDPSTIGPAIAGSKVVLDSQSRVPRFWFPDNVDVVYGVVSRSGPTVQLNADSKVRLDALSAGVGQSMLPTAGVLAALRRGRSAVIQVVGDSASDGADEWFAGLGRRIGIDYPAYNVLLRQWNLTTQWYDPPTVLQAGAGGDSRATFSGTATMQFASASTTGDLDVRLKLGPTNWVPGTLRVPACRWNSTGNQRGWWLGITSTGLLCLTWTTDGQAGTQVQKFSTVVNGLSGTQWIRATLDVDNGAAGNDLRFYTSSDGNVWTQLGATVTTAGVTAVHQSTAPYQLGSLDSSFGSVYAGDMYWVEIRDGIGGPSMVPPLVESWDQASLATNNTITLGGAPTVLLVNASEGGQNIAYWDNATRRGRALTPHGQHMLVLSDGHNEAYWTGQTWTALLSGWAANAKTLLPGVPIVAMTQNPTKSPVTQNSREVRESRAITLMTWARSQVGIYTLDTCHAFRDLAAQVSSDGVHPTPAGSRVWTDYVYQALFQGTA